MSSAVLLFFIFNVSNRPGQSGQLILLVMSPESLFRWLHWIPLNCHKRLICQAVLIIGQKSMQIFLAPSCECEGFLCAAIVRDSLGLASASSPKDHHVWLQSEPRHFQTLYIVAHCQTHLPSILSPFTFLAVTKLAECFVGQDRLVQLGGSRIREIHGFIFVISSCIDS